MGVRRFMGVGRLALGKPIPDAQRLTPGIPIIAYVFRHHMSRRTYLWLRAGTLVPGPVALTAGNRLRYNATGTQQTIVGKEKDAKTTIPGRPAGQWRRFAAFGRRPRGPAGRSPPCGARHARRRPPCLSGPAGRELSLPDHGFLARPYTAVLAAEQPADQP